MAALVVTLGACRILVVRARVAVVVDVRCTDYDYSDLRIVTYELLDSEELELASRSEPFLGQGLASLTLDTEPADGLLVRIVLRDAGGVARLTGVSAPFDLSAGEEVAVGVVLACAAASTVVEVIVPGRIFHTATSFPDGRVLLAGGLESNIGGGQLATEVLVYDPGTGSISVFSIGLPPRALHGAIALPGGSVLIAGGVGPAGPLADLWLVRPGGQLVPLDPLPATIAPATMVLLSSGEVLVAGAGAAYRLRIDEGTGALEGTTTITGAPPDVADMHFADLSGTGDRWLWAGGALRGVMSPPGVGTAGIYQDGFAALGPTGGASAALLEPRLFHSLATISGTRDALVFGGVDATVAPVSRSPEAYVAGLGGFVPVAPADPRAIGFTSVLISYPDGRLLAVGGSQFTDSLWIVPGDAPETMEYEVAFESAPGLVINRIVHTVTRLPGGGLLVAGGLDITGSGLVPEVEVLNP